MFTKLSSKVFLCLDRLGREEGDPQYFEDASDKPFQRTRLRLSTAGAAGSFRAVVENRNSLVNEEPAAGDLDPPSSPCAARTPF